MGFPRQEYRSGLPFLPSGDLLHPRIEPKSPALQADSLLLGNQDNLNYRSSILMDIGTFIERVMWTKPTTLSHFNVLSLNSK